MISRTGLRGVGVEVEVKNMKTKKKSKGSKGSSPTVMGESTTAKESKSAATNEIKFTSIKEPKSTVMDESESTATENSKPSKKSKRSHQHNSERQKPKVEQPVESASVSDRAAPKPRDGLHDTHNEKANLPNPSSSKKNKRKRSDGEEQMKEPKKSHKTIANCNEKSAAPVDRPNKESQLALDSTHGARNKGSDEKPRGSKRSPSQRAARRKDEKKSKSRKKQCSIERSCRARSSRTDDSPELTSSDEVRSKYFVKLATKCTRIRRRHSFPEEERLQIEDLSPASDLYLSDSTLSDVPSDLDLIFHSPSPSPLRSSSRHHITDDSLNGIAESSSEFVGPFHYAIPRGAREQTPPQLDLVTERKKPRLKHAKISPYFLGPLVNADSCLPFPPIDTPAFGLVQEQLAHDPFRLLLATIFLNRTRGGVALPVLFQVFDRFPTVEAMAAADLSELVSMIRCLGFQNQRAKKCIAIAQTWLDCPPRCGKRYRKLNYPCKSDGKDVKSAECIGDDDQRVAWEVAHLSGVGAYALDSWRIFCRDELRGLAKDWRGSCATPAFVPEWKSVIPLDKELQAYLTWMWLKEGWVWDRETGERTPASDKVMRAARRGATAHIEAGNWVLETSPVKRAVNKSTMSQFIE